MWSSARFFLALCLLSDVSLSQTRHELPDRLLTLVRQTERVAGESNEQPYHKCGTPLVAQAMIEWEQLPVLARREIVDRLARPLKHVSRLSASGRFRVHYDTTGFHEPALLDAQQSRIAGSREAYVDSTLFYLEHVHDVLVAELGYAPPPPDGVEGGGPEYDVYLEQLGSNISGYTVWDPGRPLSEGPNLRFNTYIVLDNDFLGHRTGGMDGLKITAAHEFYHAVQVGSYGIWTTIPNSDFYFYELSAVWIEDVLFDDVNDYYFDLPNYFLLFRDSQGQSFSFTLFQSAFYAGYERSVWAHFLAARFGRDFLREVWKGMKEEPFLKSTDRLLRAKGTTLPHEFASFSHWNYFTADRADPARFYPEGIHYPRWRPNVTQTYGVASTSTVSLESPPLATHFCRFVDGVDTISAVVVNVDLDAAVRSSQEKSVFRVELSSREVRMPYQHLGGGIKAGFSVSDAERWRILYLSSATHSNAQVAAEPSPNPVRLSNSTRLTLPVNSTNETEGEVFLFGSSLDLRFSRRYPVADYLGSRYIYVPTDDFRGTVSSGVYFLVVRCSDAEFQWKVAIVQ
jgi:hypothetical protein